ncbi:MAG: putative photosynthetic complex assembly protein PuhE [Steroidobacteraceae bacterium]
MTTLALTAAFVILLWWASTGLVLVLDHQPSGRSRAAMAGASAVTLLAVAGIVATLERATPVGACIACACAVVVWGWHELAFLTGRLTGPRRQGCPAGCHGPRHVLHAIQAIAWHELALLATLVACAWLTREAANPVATWTFALLWAMRLSAKLNLYLGVRNPGTEMLPARMGYLASFFGRRHWNPLLPVSLIAIGGLTAWLASLALGADDVFLRTAAGLTTALAALALVEHLFLVMPWSVARLWGRADARPLKGSVS